MLMEKNHVAVCFSSIITHETPQTNRILLPYQLAYWISTKPSNSIGVRQKKTATADISYFKGILAAPPKATPPQK